MQEQEEITREEIKKEFQLERMILFSDAVFAIVITLMAIEIRVPESDDALTVQIMVHHLLPLLMAYMVSFAFIGITWYNHLKIFALLKDYDKGLVIRNLLLLFFIGLFPFSASLVTRPRGERLGFFIYLAIIVLCNIVQYALQYYIVVMRPALRINADMTEHIFELRKRKVVLIALSIAAVCVITHYFIFPDPDIRSFSAFWMLLFPIIYRTWLKKQKKP